MTYSAARRITTFMIYSAMRCILAYLCYISRFVWYTTGFKLYSASTESNSNFTSQFSWRFDTGVNSYVSGATRNMWIGESEGEARHTRKMYVTRQPAFHTRLTSYTYRCNLHYVCVMSVGSIYQDQFLYIRPKHHHILSSSSVKHWFDHTFCITYQHDFDVRSVKLYHFMRHFSYVF